MNGNLERQIRKLNHERIMRVRRSRWTCVLALLVVAATVHSLLVPAFALQRKPGYAQEHVYAPQRYEENGTQQIQAEGAPQELPAQEFHETAGDVTVTVEAQEGAFPEGTCMEVRQVTDEHVQEAVEDAVAGQILWLQAVDISFFDAEHRELQPQMPIRVQIGSEKIQDQDTAATEVLHVEEDGTAKIIGQEDARTDTEADRVAFETDQFSIYVVAGIEKTVLASDGNNYRITVGFGPEACVPQDADLEVDELLAADDAYSAYAQKAAQTLALDADRIGSIRLFDIRIVDSTGEKVTVQAPVDVRIELTDRAGDAAATKIVHMADSAANGEVVTCEESETQTGRTLRFAADGFSVYAIVEEQEPVQTQPVTVADLAELNAHLDEEFAFSVHSPDRYFLNTLNANSAFYLDTNGSMAAKWKIEPAGEGTYYLSTEVDGARKYLYNPSGNLAGLSDTPRTAFAISRAADGKFYFKISGANKWLQYSGSGTGIRFWTDNNNATNSQITITYADSLAVAKDPYGLDGRSFGIAWHNDTASSAALTAEGTASGSQQRLKGLDLLMKPDVLDHDGILLVAQGADLQEWTFVSVQGDQYRLTTVVDGETKYLSISGNSVTLLDAPDETCLITATPGTGAYAGKWHFTVNGSSLNLPGNAAAGFNGATGTGAGTWMNLVERSSLDDDDFILYSAKKVSVSDPVNVYDGQQVIIYTRIWNDAKKKYEFFAVDHNGVLIPCYDAGDVIEWIGSNVNTALWEFTEYTSGGVPNYYYELQNTQYGEVIAPQVTGNQALSESTIGINLNGRRYGESTSTIIAWDETQYSYSGLKTENGRVVPCALSEAEDFYFAVIHPVDPQDELEEVRTIDSDQYGIEMKMIDFNNANNGNSRDVVQTGFFGETAQSGLLSTDLGENGYPTATALTNSDGQPLSDLFTEMQPVNHLFIESIYNESGYFEYNSTENFAHLNDDGTFTVYDAIAGITGSQEHKATRTHGQFMPYDDITPGHFAYDANGEPITNLTDVLKNELPDTHPRKGEQLYTVGSNKEVDYFFGMEMSASFTQTASGLDAWGHDIIFEFSGDDDFWFYVDGELVLDLGGVHEAETGSINFRTGEVQSSRGVSTTLYEIFRSNYEARGLSQEEISAKLEEIFEEKTVNGRTVQVFKDYSQHSMKMFYMERGAGASNLHMRFNLAAVKPGTVELSKKLSGTDSASNGLIEFPYQIYYRTRSDGGDTYHLLTEKTGDTYNVTYKDTILNVTYKDQMQIDGATYESVFLLKPGQSAVIDLPDDTLDYYIVECGVNTDVYDHVYGNGTELAGQGTGVRKDFAVAPDTMKERPRVEYDNHVAEGVMRSMTITKWLYDADGETRLHYPDNETQFSFRLYLGNEFASPDALPGANLYPYYVKDNENHYCRWNAQLQRFEPLSGIETYEQLSAYLETLEPAQRESIRFATSMNGSITRIPADYTVEVRDLVVGTQFKVEEREREIPKGYTLRLSDGYQRIDAGHEENTATTPISGALHTDETPEVIVSNQKGWGLTIQKIWSDRDFMTEHDDIYFAVYLKDAQGVLSDEPIENTVRRMDSSESEVYYFFGNEQMGTHKFEDYVVREVMVQAPQGGELIIDDQGVVTHYASVTPIDEGGTLPAGGIPYGSDRRFDYNYTVHYEVGEITTQNENVRTDTVTNARPGIRIVKTNWSGTALSGVVFTLQDPERHNVAASQYTSDKEGLVTVAYLGPGTYNLTEIRTPRGYVGLDVPLTITVAQNGMLTLSGPDPLLYDHEPATETQMETITIRNRTTGLQVIKTDADSASNDPVENAHFALYLQVMDVSGQWVRDNQPISGFEDLVTDANGVLDRVDLEHLRPATYYLSETIAPEGFQKLEEDLCFTIGSDGSIVINNAAYSDWLHRVTDPVTGETSCLISIPNHRVVKIRLQKVDIADTERTLPGAQFDLYRTVDGERVEPALYTGLTSHADGFLEKNGVFTFELAAGVYHLVETRAPNGYQLRTDPVVITVTADEAPDGVRYEENSSLPYAGGKTYDEATRTYTLKISNTTGYELPASGGRGTRLFTLGGAVLITAAALLGFARRRRRGGGSPRASKPLPCAGGERRDSS